MPFSLSCYGYMSGIFTYEQFLCKSHPVLPCLDLFAVDPPRARYFDVVGGLRVAMMGWAIAAG